MLSFRRKKEIPIFFHQNESTKTISIAIKSKLTYPDVLQVVTSPGSPFYGLGLDDIACLASEVGATSPQGKTLTMSDNLDDVVKGRAKLWVIAKKQLVIEYINDSSEVKNIKIRIWPSDITPYNVLDLACKTAVVDSTVCELYGYDLEKTYSVNITVGVNLRELINRGWTFELRHNESSSNTTAVIENMSRLIIEAKNDYKTTGSSAVIDALYASLLDQAFSKSPHEHLWAILAAISVSFEPFTLDDLSIFLNIPIEQLFEAFNSLKNIVCVRLDVIAFVDESIQDFITDSSRCIDLRFLINKLQAHAKLGMYCIELMDRQLAQQTAKLLHATASETIIVPPAVRYAAIYFWKHFQSSNFAKGIFDIAKIEICMVDNYFSWTQVLALVKATKVVPEVAEGMMSFCKSRNLIDELAISSAIFKNYAGSLTTYKVPGATLFPFSNTDHNLKWCFNDIVPRSGSRVNLKVIMDENIKLHFGHDIIRNTDTTFSELPLIQIKSHETFSTFQNLLTHSLQLIPGKFRIWKMTARQNKTVRPDVLMTASDSHKSMEQLRSEIASSGRYLWFYIELPDIENSPIPPKITLDSNAVNVFLSGESDWFIIFVRFYDPSTNTIESLGKVTIYSKKMKIGGIVPLILARKGLPPGTNLKIYEEVKPSMIDLLKQVKTFLDHELGCGDLLCAEVEREENAVKVRSIPEYFQTLPSF
ncbi:hypothetical protein HK098_006704 [Nowakowskiella sp. JEL0407]|nr:hypothetical protein HK098_006704 [Nowakowskiella sp. JEL0407]